MKAKYVLFYEAAPDFRAKVPAHFDAHRALWGTFRDDGRLLMIGPFADLGGHGYAVVTAKPAELDVEFVCLPRPLERSAGADGGELAYRVAFRVPRWDSRDGPRVIRSSVTGTLPLIP